jgi:hypothetical protein
MLVIPLGCDSSKRRQNDFNFIDEAPAPILSRFERGNQRMPGCGRMLAGMAIFGIIAAAHMTAGSAQS